MADRKIALYFGFLRHLVKKYFANLSEEYGVFKNFTNKGTFLFGNNHIQNTVIGKYSYVAYNTILRNCEIGRYCSIGPNVTVGFGDHRIDTLSTHPGVYMHSSFSEAENAARLNASFPKVVIKNDVWIGANVYIRNGVTIGNGAIVGAGSVVLSDVPDFAIVGGIPAKLIRYRFDEKVIEWLRVSEWWEKDIESLGSEIERFEQAKNSNKTR